MNGAAPSIPGKRIMSPKKLGVVNGLGRQVAPDLYCKLTRGFADAGVELKVLPELQVLLDPTPPGDQAQALSDDGRAKVRKLDVFAACRVFVAEGADAILLPSFSSHVFREEVQAELDVPLLDIMEALRVHIARKVQAGSRLGVLTSTFTATAQLFERYFGADYELVYPSRACQQALMQALHGVGGAAGGAVLRTIDAACRDVQKQGAVALLPGFAELALAAQALQRDGIDLPDINAIYADYALRFEAHRQPMPFRLGVVGGVGPAATVDFMAKVISNTHAARDQDHIRMVVDHNPQIPDRTANLLHHDADPTVALFASCKRLEADGAHAIAIPCNTAHAYVEHMQPHLQVPIINMLDETMCHVREHHGLAKTVGLLATAGTVASRVYHAAAERESIRLIAPTPEFQDKVTSAIYGRHGIKAGFTRGRCREELLSAVAHLAELGAEVLILGCTELPLVLQPTDRFDIKGRLVALVDPTTVLARRCVQLADSYNH